MEAVFEILKAILFGIVEGITEWLPVSSTGHLIILQDYISLNASEEFLSMFEVVIQLGAIMAVVILFWNRLWIIRRDEASEKWVIKMNTIRLWFKIVIACIPAAVVGIFLDEWIDTHFYKPKVVAMALIVVGLLFLFVETLIVPNLKSDVNRLHEISFKDALIIGSFQLLAAIFPGASRSGMTILGGLFLGLSRKTAAEFTFFLAIPVMFGASLLKMVKFMSKGLIMTGTEITILVAGTLTAFVVSLFVIRFLMDFIKKHSFIWFGYYRMILGALILLLRVIDFSK